MQNKIAVFFLLINLFHSTAIADDSNIFKNRYKRKEPIEKEIWYSGLVTKAIIFYTQSCSNGERKGCLNLGLIYETGEPSVQDKAKAITSYKKACEIGSSLACNNIGILFADGDGVEKDYSIAINYFDMSCKMNEEVGCKNKEIAKDQENKTKR
jgi:TPR repeat protein